MSAKDTIRILKYRIDDYDQVISLWQSVGLIMSRSNSPQGLARLIKRGADLFLVAYAGDRIIGTIMGRFDGRRGWINHLAVAPDRQNCGLGTLLVRRVEERLKLKSCDKVNLLIEPANASVQSFYEKLGYTRDDLIFMEKWLA